MAHVGFKLPLVKRQDVDILSVMAFGGHSFRMLMIVMTVIFALASQHQHDNAQPQQAPAARKGPLLPAPTWPQLPALATAMQQQPILVNEMMQPDAKPQLATLAPAPIAQPLDSAQSDGADCHISSVF